MTGMRRYVVTGGAGFIGSHVVDALLDRPETEVTVFDALTYAGTHANLEQHAGDPRLRLVRGDVAEPAALGVEVERADHVLHLAAESDIGRSLHGSRVFLHTNVLGTWAVLEACRTTRTPALVVSTDGVYGSGAEETLFHEEDALRPTNPYAASKAGADMLAAAYHATYGIDVTVVRGTNAYGPRQHPEKGFPTFTLAALDRRPLPVFGDGHHRREWLFVTDWADACLAVMDAGRPGDVVNIGGGTEVSNLDLAARICRLAGAPTSLIRSAPDRPAHDLRYGMAWERLRALGWRPRISFDDGTGRTVAWYAEHRAWVRDAIRRAEAQPSTPD